MLIEGPLKIAISDPPDGRGKILTIAFQEEFQGLDLNGQVAQFQSYLQTLAENISRLPEADPNRAGMLVVQQISEQLLPHIQSGDLAIEESMIVQIGQEQQAVALTDLLSQR